MEYYTSKLPKHRFRSISHKVFDIENDWLESTLESKEHVGAFMVKTRLLDIELDFETSRLDEQNRPVCLISTRNVLYKIDSFATFSSDIHTSSERSTKSARVILNFLYFSYIIYRSHLTTKQVQSLLNQT